MSDHRLSDVFAVPILANYLRAAVRTRIASALGRAMRGKVSDAFVSLDLADADQSSADAVGRGLARAFILHCDRQDPLAIGVIDRLLLSANAQDLPEPIRMIIEQNRVEATFGAGFPSAVDVERHYGQVDRRGLLGVRFRDADALLVAAEASAEGKNYDSLPVYSSMLFDAYRSFNWREIRASAAVLSRELLRLNDPTGSVFCAILSEDKVALHAVADHLRAANNVGQLSKVVDKVTEIANLSRHVAAACEFLERLGDAIPDIGVGLWTNRLRAYRQLPGVAAVEWWALDPAWSATTALLAGATPEQADSVIGEILNHPRWNTNDVGRHSFYKPLAAAVERATNEACRIVVDALVPYVTADVPGVDFGDALRLLIAVAERSSELKADIAVKLYPERKGIPHLLISAAPAFGKPLRISDPDRAAKCAIEHLAFQVERIAPGGKPHTGFGELMVQTSANGGLAIKIGGCAQELHGIATCRKDLSPAVLADLVRAVRNAIRDPENVNDNRSMLFEVLARLADVLADGMVKDVVDVAAQYAGDHRLDSHPLYGQDEEHSRLNPFRTDSGWPQLVRGKALLALAQICRHAPSAAMARLVPLIRLAIADPNPTMRQYGYRAVATADSTAGECLPAVVGGTRDVDANAANVALQVVGILAALVAAHGLVPPVLGVIEAQTSNPDAGVRYATATVVRQLKHAVAAGVELERLEALSSRLRCDVSRRVREAILGSAAT